MSIKFVSKNSNYMVVLRPGVEGNRALGTHSVPGLYVRFQGGLVDVKEEDMIALMRSHPSCGVDFMEIKPEEVDPYKDQREEVEPPHYTTEIKYGHAEKTAGAPRPVKMTPAMKKVVEKEAIKMLPSILKENPEILKDIIVKLAEGMKAKETAQVEVPPAKEEEVK
jgi:hypothetical protein